MGQETKDAAELSERPEAVAFGNTPMEYAYIRQITEMRGVAGKCRREADRAVDAAEKAQATCERVKSLAVDLTERSREYADMASIIARLTLLITTCAVAQVIIAIVGCAAV